MSRAAVGVLGLLAWCGSAWGDEVVLRSGRKIVGVAREEGDKIVVEMSLGTAAFSKDDVVSITPGRTPLHDYQDKLAALRESENADEVYALAQWARENNLPRYVRPTLEKVIALDTDHEKARAGLGYMRHKGRWMTKDDVHKEMGFVWFEGRWMSALEMRLIQKKRLDAQLAKIERDAVRKSKKEEDRERQLQAAREQAERLEELRRLRELDRRVRRGWGYGPYRFWYGDALTVVDVIGRLGTLNWPMRLILPVPRVGPGFPLP